MSLGSGKSTDRPDTHRPTRPRKKNPSTHNTNQPKAENAKSSAYIRTFIQPWKLDVFFHSDEILNLYSRRQFISLTAVYDTFLDG